MQLAFRCAGSKRRAAGKRGRDPAIRSFGARDRCGPNLLLAFPHVKTETTQKLAAKPFRSLVAALALSTLVLASCGSDDNSNTNASAKPADCATGAVTGAGSTFVQNIALQWVKDYSAACSGSTINYNGVGSGAGVQQFNSGTVDFAGTDVALSQSEKDAAKAKYGDVLTIPWSAGGIAVEFKLAGVTDVQLSPATLAGIFGGKIATWNDAAIAADNPGVTLPSTPIQVIHRSDGSGTTAAFTAYLTAVAPEAWTAGTGKEVKWPVGQGAKGSDGVTAAVKAADGAIGYAEVSFARANQLGVAKIKNNSGAFVAPESANVTAALGAATVDADGKVTLDYKAPDASAYAISTVTYAVVPKKPSDAAKSALLKSFVNYALDGGQNSAAALYYAPLADNVKTSAKTAAQSIGS